MRSKKSLEQLSQEIEAKRRDLREKMKKLTERERVAAAKAATEERKKRINRSRRLGAALAQALALGLISIDVVRAWVEKLPDGKERDQALAELMLLRA